MEKDNMTATPTNTKEIEIFKELGLKNQVSLREVQTVMDGMPYYQVSDKQLNKLFGMGWIKVLTWWHNQGVRTAHAPIATIVVILASIAAVTLLAVGASIGGMAWMLCLSSVLPLMIAFAANDLERHDFRISGLLVAQLTREPIEHTSIKIPYGAALRYQEAKAKGVFDSFTVVYPNVIEQEITRDPAIIGNRRHPSGNGWQEYMIVYWDIEKDKARTIQKIKDYKKFKV